MSPLAILAIAVGTPPEPRAGPAPPAVPPFLAGAAPSRCGTGGRPVAGEAPLPQVGIGARLRLVCPGLRLSGAVPTPGAAIALPISTGSG